MNQVLMRKREKNEKKVTFGPFRYAREDAGLDKLGEIGDEEANQIGTVLSDSWEREEEEKG